MSTLYKVKRGGKPPDYTRPATVDGPIGILYEHPLWFEPLFAELNRRDTDYEKLHAGELVFDPGEGESPYSLVFNRMSPSGWTRGHADAVFRSLHFLAYLDAIGVDVVNGHEAFQVEISKAHQCALFARLGLRYPAARAVSDRARVLAAAEGLRFPVLVKPNVGGSGAGIRLFATPAELGEAMNDGIELGLDGTGWSRNTCLQQTSRSSGLRSSAASSCTRSGSDSFPEASISALPTTASSPASPTASPRVACRSSASTRRTSWSKTRSESSP